MQIVASKHFLLHKNTIQGSIFSPSHPYAILITFSMKFHDKFIEIHRSDRKINLKVSLKVDNL